MKFPCLLIALASFLTASPVIHLEGEWRFAMDAEDARSAIDPEPWKFPDTIQLPGTVTGQGFGEAAIMATVTVNGREAATL